MEYTLNKEQIKFLEAVLGGMSKDDFYKFAEERLEDKELLEVSTLIENRIGFALYSDLYKILYG